MNLPESWKNTTTLPSSFAYAGMPYQVFGSSSGAVAVMATWTRSASARSSGAIFGDRVEHRLQAVGLLGALLALGAELGGALLHRGALLRAEPRSRSSVAVIALPLDVAGSLRPLAEG